MSKRRGELTAACLFLGPNFLGFLAFVAFPVIFSIAMAFTNWDLTLHNRFRGDTVQWVWLRNFYDMLTHAEFWKYLGNTLFLMMTIPVGIAGSLFLAVLLTQKLRSDMRQIRWGLAVMSLAGFTAIGLLLSGLGYGMIALIFSILAGVILALGFTTGATVYRTLFYLPSFTSGVAVFLLWKQMYNPLRGPINVSLSPVLNGLASTVNATPAGLWSCVGYGLWIVALVAVAWLGYCTIRNWIWGEFGVGTGLLSFAALAVGALILYALGRVSLNLPAMAGDGLQPPQWLDDVHWAKPAIMIMALWMAVGSNNMLLFIAGISNVPPALYEAADIDGAS